ncbi:MAG TPA: decaprenyl-phosphate phosphoribosyltransferase [Oculatellaceae cyanobacterium]
MTSSTNADAEIKTDQSSRFSILALIKQLRPKQWAKNAIVFAPLLFSGNFTNPERVEQAVLCAIAFCAISSAVYILNDLVDIKADQAHPTKCKRPLASGQIPVSLAVVLMLALLAGGLVAAFIVRPTLDLICLTYLTINILYSLKLKDFPILDILCIASGFVLRAVAGAAAVHVVPSAWFLLCTTFGALFLGLEKRRYETTLLIEKPENHRKSLQGYTPTLIKRLESLITPSLLATYSFYTFQSTASHHGQWMMITIPLVLYGVMRYQLISEKGASTGTPEDILGKDRPIQITILLWILACSAVIYGDPEAWVNATSHTLDSLRK